MRTTDSHTEPHSIEAEQQLLGACLTNEAAFDQIAPETRGKHFYDPVHGRIYDLIAKRRSAGKLATPVTIATMLADDPSLKELGGPAYVVRLAGAAVATRHAGEYAAMVRELWQRREVIAAAKDAAEVAASPSTDMGKTLGALQRLTSEAFKGAAQRALSSSFVAIATEGLQMIHEASERGGGIQTGIPQLDRMTGGLHRGDSVILAGRPSMGKSTIAHVMGLRMAKAGIPVFYESAEMPRRQLAVRAASFLAADQGERIPYADALRGRLRRDQMERLGEVYRANMALPFVTGDRECRNLTKLAAEVRRVHAEMEPLGGLGVLIVDYVQRLEDETAKSFYEAASRASDTLKTLAVDLDIAVVALSQIGRQVDLREPAIPQLSDLKDSGRLEEDADAVIFVYRAQKYLEQRLDEVAGDVGKEADLQAAIANVRGKADLIVAKQRNGPLGTATINVDLPVNWAGDVRPVDARANHQQEILV